MMLSGKLDERLLSMTNLYVLTLVIVPSSLLYLRLVRVCARVCVYDVPRINVKSVWHIVFCTSGKSHFALHPQSSRFAFHVCVFREWDIFAMLVSNHAMHFQSSKHIFAFLICRSLFVRSDIFCELGLKWVIRSLIIDEWGQHEISSTSWSFGRHFDSLWLLWTILLIRL